MTDYISILITGNPNATTGATDIGSIGDGLNSVDPICPSTIKGDFALVIKDNASHSIYCLNLKCSLLEVGIRTGVLNIQLRIPHNKAIADTDGNEIDPYTFLRRLFDKYSAKHLTKYPGASSWNFNGDGKMTDDELQEFLAPYKLVEHPLPSRYLTGDGEGTIILPEEKLKAFAMDHAYPELSQYGTLWLSTDGMTTPEDLSLLKVPRTPEYDVYVNGVRQDCTLREGDRPFTILVNPKKTWQEPKELRIDITTGKIDKVKERIDFEIKFEDKTVSRIINVELQGLDDKKERKNVIRDILKSIVPESNFGPINDPKISISEDNNSIIITTTGEDTLKEWQPVCREIKYVSQLKSTRNPDGNYMLVFKYAKPIVETSGNSSKNQTNRNESLQESKEQAKEIAVYLTPEDDKYISDLKNLQFKIKFSDGQNSLSIDNIKVSGIQEVRTLPSKESINCYSTKIMLETPFCNKRGLDIKVKSGDSRYIMTITGSRLTKDNYIVISVIRLTKMQYLVRNGIIQKFVLLLLVFAAGWFIGEYFTPITSISNSVKNYFWQTDTVPQKSELDIKNIESQQENISDSINRANQQQSTTTVVEETQQQNNQGALPDDQIKNLNSTATNYLQKITNANLTFNEVAVIQNWLNDNEHNKNYINDYNTIKGAIGKYAECRNIINRINDENTTIKGKLAIDFLKVTQNIKGGNELKQLRLKMQNYCYKGNNPLDTTKIKAEIYELKSKNINSFKNL